MSSREHNMPKVNWELREREKTEMVVSPKVLHNTLQHKSKPLVLSSVKVTEDEWVNNLNRTAILNTKRKMEEDPAFGSTCDISLDAVWKKGVVTAEDGLVCYPPPELQLNAVKKGPSVYSYCPMVSGGCFSFVLMMRAAELNYHFQTMGTHMKADANFIGFYQNDWAYSSQHWHPWEQGIKVEMLVQTSHQTEEQLEEIAEYADKYCPATEVMKRDFPVEISFLEKAAIDEDIDWSRVPCYYNMNKYNEIANSNEKEYIIKQQADMFWHCQNENKQCPESLMTFNFPNDSNSSLVLSYSKPIASGKYPSPVAACFFGGLSSFLHTVAVRVYAHGYLVEEIKGNINATANKRKVFGVDQDEDSHIFPDGAFLEIKIVTNAPENELPQILMEAENMSPVLMNWRHEHPLDFEIHKTEHRKDLCKKRINLFGFMRNVLKRGDDREK